MDNRSPETQQAIAKVIAQMRACAALMASVQETDEEAVPELVRNQAAAAFSSTAVVARVLAQRYLGTVDAEEAAEVLAAAAASLTAMAKIVPFPMHLESAQRR